MNKKRVCAVGTTSMRSIESSVSTDGFLKPYDGWTNKFIFPPYDFSIANCMITNFHTPLSTLLMMVSAFAGHEFMMEAYETAIKEKYKFYSVWRCHVDFIRTNYHSFKAVYLLGKPFFLYF